MQRLDEIVTTLSKGGDIGLYDKSAKGLNFIEILAAAIGHEIEHTTKDNVKTLITDKPNVETEPTKVSDKIVDQTNENKKKD